jgi:hypothetical protein
LSVESEAFEKMKAVGKALQQRHLMAATLSSGTARRARYMSGNGPRQPTGAMGRGQRWGPGWWLSTALIATTLVVLAAAAAMALVPPPFAALAAGKAAAEIKAAKAAAATTTEPALATDHSTDGSGWGDVAKRAAGKSRSERLDPFDRARYLSAAAIEGLDDGKVSGGAADRDGRAEWGWARFEANAEVFEGAINGLIARNWPDASRVPRKVKAN